MTVRLLILLRWIALALLVLAVVLIILRWRYPRMGANSRGLRGLTADLMTSWRVHRENQQEQATNIRALRGRTVLLADPDSKSLRVMTWKLEKFGCTVIKARNGAQALSQLTHEAVDVAFVDTLLPDVSAYDLYNSLPDHNLPVVFLGVLPNQWDALRELGPSVACLAKPYDPDEAASQAGRLLRRSSIGRG